MKNKTEVLYYFQYLCAFVSTQFPTSIKILRSDGGGEYMSSKVKDFLHLKGIVHQVSCPYTREQNGVLERKNRHIRETIVTLLQHASLPSIFWHHACAIATSLINRMVTPILHISSLFEKLYNVIPDLDSLRVFGCTCYPLMTPHRMDKLQPKTIRCVFIGFANGYKGYICYNATLKKCIISRHIIFEETIFPYALTSPIVTKSSLQTSYTSQRQSIYNSPCLAYSL